MILNKSQAEAVYSAMCELNNVSMRLDGCVATGVRCREDENGVVFVFDMTTGHTGGPSEEYENQAAFASAYGLNSDDWQSAVSAAAGGLAQTAIER